MEKIKINNTSELLAFIKRTDISVIQATEIVRKALNILIIPKNTKDQLITETEYYIDNYCQDSKAERPLFLEMNLPDIGNRK